MFGFKPRQFTDPNMLPKLSQLPLIEPLEDRQLLSATVHPAESHTLHKAATHKAVHVAKTHTKTVKTVKTSHKKSKSAGSTSTTSTGSSSGTPGLGSGGTGGLGALPIIPFPGQTENTITFAEALSSVASGLTSLASTDGLAAPTSSQTVFLGNSNGVETYSLHFSGAGTTSTITVDENGNPVTKPTQSTTTYSDLTTSDAAAATEIAAIATALHLTAPTDSTTVNVTTSNGVATYSVHLPYTGSTTVPVTSASTSAAGLLSGINPVGPIALFGGNEISVDASGNPVGNQRLPFSVLPTGIQSAINSNVPTGATALDPSSSQIVCVQTVGSVTLYTTTFSFSGTITTVTVNASGTPISLPNTTTAEFSTIPQAAQNELQTLATADGVTTAISATQSVTVYAESNGTTIYAITLSTSDSTGTTTSTSSTSGFGFFGDTITIAVDAAGNPTVPPGGGLGRGGFPGGGGGGWGPSPIGGPIPLAFA